MDGNHPKQGDDALSDPSGVWKRSRTGAGPRKAVTVDRLGVDMADNVQIAREAVLRSSAADTQNHPGEGDDTPQTLAQDLGTGSNLAGPDGGHASQPAARTEL
jgi:hypothetical protein